ncbi:hypothetical protein [Companilactobacillus muriivasis]|uniref:hypothetical protein n=1 Tax=Companilactobacillus muriivasis TaxID=3081444 RepID=UPI0030C69E14
MKHRKNSKYFMYLLISLLATSFLFFPSVSEVSAQTNDDQGVEPFHPPSKGAEHGIFWGTSGFNTQPEANYYIKRGESVSINSNFVRYIGWFSWWGTSKYDWYENIDGKGWKRLNKDSASMKVQTNKDSKVKNIYYQAINTFRNDTYYSEMAHVHVLSNEIKAESVKIEPNKDYLYSTKDNKLFDNWTYIDDVTTPKDSTGKLQWTLGELKGKETVPVTENELATVNSSGLVTAKNGAMGTLNVTGYIVNEDGTSVSDTKQIRIGGGLEDQTSHVKKKATFNIETGRSIARGNETAKIDIKWHRIKANKDTFVAGDKDNPLSMTTNILDESDDNNQYYAIITAGDAYVKTNYAHLHVLPPIDPTVHLETRMENISFPKGNSDNKTLHHVTNDDVVKYTMTLKNGGIKNLKKSLLKLPLNQHTEVTAIKFDGLEHNNHSFNTIEKSLEVSIDDLEHDHEHKVEIETKTKGVNDEHSYSFKPILSGFYDDMKHKYESDGDLLTLHYTDDQIAAEFKKIHFQPVTPFEREKYKFRTSETVAPNPVVSIRDSRRNRVPVKVTVKQTTNFINGENVLDANLFFVSQNAQPISLNEKVTVAQTDRDQPLQSITWDESHGLILHVDNTKAKPPGNYSATLVWNIENAP